MDSRVDRVEPALSVAEGSDIPFDFAQGKLCPTNVVGTLDLTASRPKCVRDYPFLQPVERLWNIPPNLTNPLKPTDQSDSTKVPYACKLLPITQLGACPYTAPA